MQYHTTAMLVIIEILASRPMYMDTYYYKLCVKFNKLQFLNKLTCKHTFTMISMMGVILDFINTHAV